MRKFLILSFVLAVVLAVQLSRPTTASACDDYWGYSYCVDRAQQADGACSMNCDQIHSVGSSSWWSCLDYCRNKRAIEECRCYIYCDQWAMNQYC